MAYDTEVRNATLVGQTPILTDVKVFWDGPETIEEDSITFRIWSEDVEALNDLIQLLNEVQAGYDHLKIKYKELLDAN